VARTCAGARRPVVGGNDAAAAGPATQSWTCAALTMSRVLETMARKNPEIEPAIRAVRILAALLPETAPVPGVPHQAAAEARLDAGIRALEGEPLLGGAQLLVNVRALVTALESVMPGLEDVAGTLDQGLSVDDADELARAGLAGEWSVVGHMAQRCGLDPHALVTLVDYAARPALRAGARAVDGLIGRSGWQRGTCPACGAEPQLAELHGGGSSVEATGQRVLRCGRCLTGWPFPRMRCPACGETDHQRLAYLHGAGEDAFRRADVCSTCNSYLKSIAVLAPLGFAELLEMDLVTAALDFGAQEQGFHR
jgi:FdhE protein